MRDSSILDIAADASRYAQVAADRLGLRVVELTDIAEHHAAANLLTRVWQADSASQVIGADVIRAFAYSGNYVAGAYLGEALVGTVMGFQGDGHLHSHIAGVDPDRWGSGVGYALKQHQRAWALRRGILEVHWTFDPLVSRNAYFNLCKLGALPSAYLPDFYGPMTDGINVGDVSDRLYIRWQLDSDRARAAARGEPLGEDTNALRAGGAAVYLDRAGDRPVPAGDLPDKGQLLVAVPLDVEELRPRDPALARTWRFAVRERLTVALAGGFHIAGISKDGFYLLESA